MATGAARWPLGLICCFGLLIFLVAASIVLALIPVYLPKHGADIQPLTNPEQFAYLQYSGTAENGVAGSPNNIDDINNQFTNQVGVSKNLVKTNRVQVVESASRKRKRHTLKSSLVPRKRQVITFQILIVIQIVFPITCQGSGCQNRMRGNVENQISSRPSITLSFTFIGITTGPIRFSLIFIGFFLTIPDIFVNGGGGGQRTSTTAVQSTTTTATTTVTTATTTIEQSTVSTTVITVTTTVATTPITTETTTTTSETVTSSTTGETSTNPTSESGTPSTGSSESTGTGITTTITSSETIETNTPPTSSSETTGTNTPTTGSSETIQTETSTITSSSETTGTGSSETTGTSLPTITSTETTETAIPTTSSSESTETESTGTGFSEETTASTSTGTEFITTTENEGLNTTQTITISTSQEFPETTDFTFSSSITTTISTEPGLTSDLIDTFTTLETTISTTDTTSQEFLTTTQTTIPISETTIHVTSETSTTVSPTTETSTFETPEHTSDIIASSDTTPPITITTETPQFTSDLIDLTESTDSSSTIIPTVDIIDSTDATTTSTPATTVADQCSADVRQGLEWFSLYGLIAIQNFSTTSNVKNRAIVCGPYTSSESGDFGASVTTDLSPTNFTLQINGNLVSGNPINMNKGSLGLGTSPSHTISSSSNTQATVDGRLINLNQGNEGANARVDDNLSDTCQSITTSLLALSQRLSQLSNTSGNTIDLPGSQPSGANININAVDGNGISVISLDGNTLLNNGNVQSIEVVIDSSVSSDLQLVVINLSGTSITFGGGSNLGGSWLQSSEGRSRTIWNLYEATTFNNNNGKAWMGSTLAPSAVMTQNGQVTGAVAVKSLTSTASIDSPLVIVPECI